MGQAGASAQAEYERRRARERKLLMRRAKITVPLLLALCGLAWWAGNHPAEGLGWFFAAVAAVKLGHELWRPAQQTRAWGRGAEGERATADVLRKLEADARGVRGRARPSTHGWRPPAWTSNPSCASTAQGRRPGEPSAVSPSWVREGCAGCCASARPGNSGDDVVGPAEVMLRPWRRYGHDRLYANANGQTLGFVDRATDEIHADNAAARQAIAEAYRAYTDRQS